ncbi:excalibur calcium-binding domain-containing protein [Bifidobacterium animalis]|uniref:excalibur calcium-binding domain-containing protein n=1 Tax=Bifidobacterium animalis TaxID=28025 RepID=UPI0022B26C64|nr:excalibur calcium-binding domain-containing protein [Bifidobacterium animalis]
METPPPCSVFGLRFSGYPYSIGNANEKFHIACENGRMAGPLPLSSRNCMHGPQAGKAPLHRGQPGYAPKLDRDGDGIACE